MGCQELENVDQYGYLRGLVTKNKYTKEIRPCIDHCQKWFNKQFELGVLKQSDKILYLEHYSLWIRNMTIERNGIEIHT